MTGYRLTPEQEAHVDTLVAANATDRRIFNWLIKQGYSRHDAFVALDLYVYGEPVTCQPLEGS
jgi:hypothetical protein